MAGAQRVNFSVPFTKQSIEQPAEGKAVCKISGKAINVGTTRNRTTFLAEELSVAAKTLQGKPLLKNHYNEVESIAGKVTKASWDAKEQAVMFEAEVKDPMAIELINEGLCNAVSVGAMIQSWEVVRNEDTDEVESVIVHGIDFLELSLVAVPADPNAGFTKAIMESLQDVSEKDGKFYLKSSPKSFTERANEFVEVLNHSHSKSDSKESVEEAQMAEENKTLESLRAEKAALELEKAQLEADIARASVEQLKQQKEAATTKVVASTTTEAPTDKTKGTVATEAPKTETNEGYSLGIAESGKGMAISGDYEALGTKRLSGGHTTSPFAKARGA